MKTSHPSRIAFALLNRFIPDDEPLAGDLLEEFGRRQSQLWLWRQVLLAILIRSFRTPRDQRPLKLAESGGAFEIVEDGGTSRPKSVNLTASPVVGIGGLGLLALAVLVTIVSPQAWWVVLAGVLAGGLLGIVLVLVRRRRIESRNGFIPRCRTRGGSSRSAPRSLLRDP
jgi:hypothetical protein